MSIRMSRNHPCSRRTVMERGENMELNERAYWTHEVAERLEIGESTLRKWCLALEEQGYHFTKGEQDSRAFLEQDIAILLKMKGSIRGRKKSMKDAAKTTLNASRTPLVQEEQDEGRTTPVPDVMSLIAIALEERDKQHASQLKAQEQEFAEKMQNVLEEQLELQERNLSVKLSRLEESNKRIEEHLISKKPWWKFWE